MVVLYGAPTNMLDFEQMAGRGGRDGRTNCLVLLIAEPWIFEKDKEKRKNRNGTICPKVAITEDEVFQFAQSEDCLREFLAKLNNDTTEDGQ